jgi:3D (Asp-Asp-Asp) domain-containing protein
MKKILMFVPLIAMLTACGTTDPYAKRADQERERQERYVERSIDKAPKWMFEMPKSTSAVYSNGTNTSSSWEMALHKAKADAYGKICMTAGGTTSQQTKIYRADQGKTSSEVSEMVIRASCKEVDITGVEVAEKKIMQEGSQYRAYVLIALPTGDANVLKRAKDQQRVNEMAARRAPEAFKELDKQ